MERARDRGWTWRGHRDQVAVGVLLALLVLLALAESIRGGSDTQPVMGHTVSAPAGDPAARTGGPPPTGATDAGAVDAPANGAFPPSTGTRDGLPQGAPLAIVVFPLLALATTLPLLLLWGQPLLAAVLICAASVLSIAGFHTLTVAGVIAQLVAAYRCGLHASPAPAVLVTVPFPVLAVALEATGATGGGLVPVLTLVVACLVPAAALGGIARRAGRKAMADTVVRQVVADSLLEHTARGERARIARELHDVVAHHISMVAVQAETARLAVPGMPAAGAERLLAIGDTARAALTEMRRLLGVLREDAQAEATWRPQPGLRLHELNELLDESREASGAGTRLILRGAPVELDPGVELAAYRIIQEALTNARRHAPGAAVDVELHYADDALRVTVRDNGPGPSGGNQAGHGLAGMRERAVAVGGELRTGPAPGGGFLVEARLPGKDADDASMTGNAPVTGNAP
ncbi:sensor histidine kinase [Nonomuraea sp. NBC_00507]|uniref:sensor histidine kinase n=1 Tax=Nonomuraea sp. NBC_00507 TaxID=2976002 RepID=UPI002E19A26E